MSNRTMVLILVIVVAAVIVGVIGGAAALGVFSLTRSETVGTLPPAGNQGPPQGMPVPGPGLTVEEALAAAGGSSEPFLVTGYVFVYADGSAKLSDLILESYPPQPGGATLLVEGLDTSTLALTEGSEGGVSWSDSPVRVLGTIDADAGVMTATSSSM